MLVFKNSKKTFDISLISKTKSDDSFPSAQFKIEGYKRFWIDRDAYGGGFLFYVNENCRSLEICLPNTFIENLPLELRLLNSKWLMLGTYGHPSQNEPTFVSEIQKLLIYYRSSYDFNMSFSNENMKDLCDKFELNHIIKYPTRFKSSNPHVLIIFILTKIKCFLIHLLSRQAFLTTIV